MHTYRQKDNGMYILSRNDIDEIATETLKEYSPTNLLRPTPLKTTDFLVNYLGLVEKTKYICDFDSGILGLTVMGDEVLVPSYDIMYNKVILEETYGNVLISPRLSGHDNLPRRRYTEMHEASHFILHKPYFAKLEQSCAAMRTEYPCAFVACRKIELHNEDAKTDKDWLEKQADYLAAALLMPRQVFHSYVLTLFRKNGMFGNCLFVSKNTKDAKVYKIIQDVAEAFCVSHQAAKIRMINLGLLRESRYVG